MALLPARTLFLHIGLHKTGTSSVQRAYRQYDDGKTKYAQLAFENHSIPLYTCFSRAYASYHLWQRAGHDPEEVERIRSEMLTRLRAELKASKRRNVIISGEDISVLDEAEFGALVGFLSENHGGVVQVLAYVRNPMSYLVSSLQQQIRSDAIDTAVHGPAYRRRLDPAITTLGRQNVHIHDYDAIGRSGKGIVEHFAAQIGIAVPPEETRVNVGLSKEASQLVLALNRIVGRRNPDIRIRRAKDATKALISHWFPGRLEVPPQLLTPYIDADDCRWLEAAAGISYSVPSLSQGARDSGSLEQYLTDIDDDTFGVLIERVSEHCRIPARELYPGTVLARLLSWQIERTNDDQS